VSFQTAELLRQVLVPFLAIGGSLLGVLLAYLMIQRGVREVKFKRRARLMARYRPLVDVITQSGVTPPVLEQLRQAPLRHRPIVAELLLSPLHATRGAAVAHVREAVSAIGLIEHWSANLQDRRWWVRADSIRALGFVELVSAVPAILHALNDDHEEVRAAAVDALARLNDPRAIAALLEHIGDGAHHQRARVIDALRSLGAAVTPALVDVARAHPDCTRLVADILGLIGTTAALEPLVMWCADSRPEVRVAALEALGSVGLDNRSYYFALRALGDADPRARAMAARALGLARRDDAVDYLVPLLDDEWLPAAQAAGALRRLGARGVAALQARSADTTQAGDLARQMLWIPQPAAARA
jgi:HEAT repeat protein